MPYEISSIDFSVLRPELARDISILNVTERQIYDSNGAIREGLRDPVLGPTARGSNAVCETCGESTSTCSGHFGHVNFAVPLFHITRVSAVVKELRSRCYICYQKLNGKHCKTHSKETQPKVRWTQNALFVNGKQTCAHEIASWLGEKRYLLLEVLLVPPNCVRPPPTIADGKLFI